MFSFRNTKNIDPLIVHQLSKILYEHNPHAKSFQMAKQCLGDGNTQNLKLRLISDKTTDGRIYN